jgi:hypothetical protein
VNCGLWRLTLELPGDPNGRLTDNEPEGPYVGAIVKLYYGTDLISTDSLWGIFEDLDAGCSSDHPFWEHLAEVTRDLASNVTNQQNLRLQLGGHIAKYQAILAEV